MTEAAALRSALIATDPRLSRFDPLARIIFYEDFSQGYGGFTETIGNYEHSLDSVLPEMREFRPPQLSNRPMWDTGVAGTLTGSYALKLATRPVAGAVAAATKRMTMRDICTIRMECWFGFKPEASDLILSATDVRGFGFLLDAQNDDMRMLPRIRFLNAEDGERREVWQVKAQSRGFRDIGDRRETVSIPHYTNEGYVDLPDGRQELCYNELPTKMNWHYLAVTFDLANMSFVGLRCNDRSFDIASVRPWEMPAMANLRGLLNTIFFVETAVDKRAFLYLDSILLSSEV